MRGEVPVWKDKQNKERSNSRNSYGTPSSRVIWRGATESARIYFAGPLGCGIIPPASVTEYSRTPHKREILVSDRPWSSTAPPGEFRTYVSAEETLKEFTIRAVVLGALFGLLFGAVTVYVGLRAGLTVSASIPI